MRAELFYEEKMRKLQIFIQNTIEKAAYKL